jgi:hypothetical protein
MQYTRTLTAAELEGAYGFLLQQAIPVDRKGDVPRIAIFQELNPFAPDQIYCSAVVRDGAETLVRSGRPTPVFIRLDTNRWADCGMWKAIDLDSNPATAKKTSNDTGRWNKSNHGPVWAILHMEQAIGKG